MMNNKGNFTQAKNNPREFTDYTKEEFANQAAVERNIDSRRDAETIKRKRLHGAYSHILFVDDCDLQLGGQGHDAIRHKCALDTVMQCYNTVFGIGGDVTNSANKNGKTDVFSERISPREQLKVAKMLFEPYSDRISFIIAGNHDAHWGVRNRETNTNWSESLAGMLKVDYAMFALLYTIPLLTPDTLEVKECNVLVVHTELSGNAATVTDKTLNLLVRKLSSEGIMIDVLMSEHLHTGSELMQSISQPYYDKNGCRIGNINHTVHVLNGKSFQTTNTDFGSRNMFVNTTNLKAIDLSWRKNPYYTKNNSNTTEKYTIFANAFSVLSLYRNEPSMAMNLYLNKYKIPSLEKFKEKWEKKTLTDLAMEIDSFSDKYNHEYEKLNIAKQQKKVTEKELDL